MTLRQALEAVIKESNNEYAKTYADAALRMGNATEGEIVSGQTYSKVLNKVIPVIGIKHKPTGKMMVGEEMRVQLLYVLSNLNHWRGERAREVKKVLKEYIKRSD